MKISLIIPVYNEQATIQKILDKLLPVNSIGQVVIVDDGSSDQTVAKIEKFFKKQKQQNNNRFLAKEFKLIKKANGGKGSAVRRGLKEVKHDYVLIQDADLEYDPQDIPTLVEALDKEGVEVVYGSRFLGPHSNLLFWHRAGNWFLNLLVNVLYNTTLSDMETCYKLLPTKLFKELKLQADSFDLEPEITCKVLKKGINIFEVPISYVGRGFADGKKITWQDGLSALWTIIRLRFTP